MRITMAVDTDLGNLLAKVLPAGVDLMVRHVSSTPTRSAPLFAGAPGQDPEPTFCEKHFLSVSIDQEGDADEIIIFGMEVLVYNTAHLTTIFVSKADSTGFLNLLELPPKVSVLRLISHTFLSFLIRTRQRPGVRLVVSLFARAQTQYLFPGSSGVETKHILDDRGLIKWWCRAIDPILREYEPESVSQETKPDQTVEAAMPSATAYLIVPGCDRFETRSFFPSTAKSDAQDRMRWLNSYPLNQLCPDPKAPLRCLIPRLPDDPKTRFLIDLDDELPKPAEGENASRSSGQWRSVKSLDQFWEMMSFRQECSAGRLVGFLWLVINPPGLMPSTSMASQTRTSTETHPLSNGAGNSNTSPAENNPRQDVRQSEAEEASAEAFADPATPQSTSNHQTDPAPSFGPHPVGSSPELRSKGQSSDANPFSWPEAGRGEVILSETDYKQMMDSILDHFYDNKDVETSTRAYINHVASLADKLVWGRWVIGGTSRVAQLAKSAQPVKGQNTLDPCLIRKRKKPDSEGDRTAIADGRQVPPSESGDSQTAGVNVLNARLVRKKKKT